MFVINQLLPTYQYEYFDKYNQLQIRELNIFQCFLRKAFGKYPETHLKTVVDRIYQLTLNEFGEFDNEQKNQRMLRLVAKAGDYEHSLPDGKVRYNIEAESNKRCFIRTIHFCLVSKEEGPTSHGLRWKDGRLVARNHAVISTDPWRLRDIPKSEQFEMRKKAMKIGTKLLTQIFHSTNIDRVSSEFLSLQWSGMGYNSLEGQGRNLDEEADTYLKSLGWERDAGTNDLIRYTLRRERMSPPEKAEASLSLNFAVRYLKH